MSTVYSFDLYVLPIILTRIISWKVPVSGFPLVNESVPSIGRFLSKYRTGEGYG